MFQFSEHVLKICIAQLAKYVGFKSINELAFEILIDLLTRFIIDFGRLSANHANQCNRTQVNFNDIQFVLKSLNLRLDDLIDYLENVKIPFAGGLLPNYPVNTSKQQTFRIQFPSQSECCKRKEFYQDWQPSLDLSLSQYLSELNPEEQHIIENRLEQLDLIDYIDQERKLKITDDLNLNRKLLNKIRTKVSELNIGGFTELSALVPNYIYLSPDGQALSFGDKPGKLPEARQHQQQRQKHTLSKSKNSKSKDSHYLKKSSKKSSHKLSKSERKKKSKQRLQSIDYNIGEQHRESEKQTTIKLVDKRIVATDEQLVINRSKSEEEIVGELMSEMISSVEDKFNESFYDENEAAKTLLLFSCDSSKSVLSSVAESQSIDESENQIDYSLNKSFNNYDLNNNYSVINDLNNNTIDTRKENGHSFNSLTNGKLDRSLMTGDHQNRLNDLKNLTSNEEENTYSKQINSNNLPKLKFKLTFDKYKRSLANHNNDSTINQQPKLNAYSIKSHTHQNQTTKDKQSKRKNKKSNPIEESEKHAQTSNQTKTSRKKNNNIPNEQNEEVYFCPTCNEQDDGTPMIACDGNCKEWFHWRCQNVFIAPKEENWYCLNCSVQQTLEEYRKSKKLNKKKTKELNSTDTPSSSNGGKKRSNKHIQKQEDKKSHKNQSQNDTYYCPTCSKPDNGRLPMVGCDGDCDSWFHYKCVGLTNTPPEDESWYCSNCKKKKKHKKLKK